MVIIHETWHGANRSDGQNSHSLWRHNMHTKLRFIRAQSIDVQPKGNQFADLAKWFWPLLNHHLFSRSPVGSMARTYVNEYRSGKHHDTADMVAQAKDGVGWLSLSWLSQYSGYVDDGVFLALQAEKSATLLESVKAKNQMHFYTSKIQTAESICSFTAKSIGSINSQPLSFDKILMQMENNEHLIFYKTWCSYFNQLRRHPVLLIKNLALFAIFTWVCSSDFWVSE